MRNNAKHVKLQLAYVSLLVYVVCRSAVRSNSFDELQFNSNMRMYEALFRSQVEKTVRRCPVKLANVGSGDNIEFER